MTPQARKIIMEVSARRCVSPHKVMSPCRLQRVFYARMEIAKRLSARGYSGCRIGAMLSHDHTTISFYLGRLPRKPTPEPTPVWRAPRVRHVKWLISETERRRRERKAAAALPKPKKYYLRPYAGADEVTYRWKERPDVSITEAHRR